LFKRFGGCKWRNRGLLHYNSSECLLYALKTSRVLLWTTKQDGITFYLQIFTDIGAGKVEEKSRLFLRHIVVITLSYSSRLNVCPNVIGFTVG